MPFFVEILGERKIAGLRTIASSSKWCGSRPKACYEAVEATVPQLLRLVEDPDDDLCFKVLGLLAAFPRCASQTVPALRALVENPDTHSERRDAAAETIALLESD